jgi:nitroimidazol reductase NimA-like FMN-containing flavoprotein (pyridoxamine 5'-phosphate oxidase superfamily)
LAGDLQALPGMATTTTTHATALTDRGEAPWSLAEERLRNPEKPRTSWLATVRADGAPHLMPLITAWLDDALYFLSGEQTQKGRSLAHEPRCAIAMSSTTLPSLDLIVEGRAERVTEDEALRRVTDHFRTKLEWPLEVRDGRVDGPNAPTAGPPPYAMFRVVPTTIFGLPGMVGMEQFEPEELPRPTRWDVT